MNYYVHVYCGPDGWQPFRSAIPFHEAVEIIRGMNDDDPRPFRISDVNGVVVLRGKREVEATVSSKMERPADFWFACRATPIIGHQSEQGAVEEAREQSSKVGEPYYVYRAAAVLAVGFVEERFEGEN